MPYLLDQTAISGIHGNNERVSAANVWRAARFYHTLIQGADAGIGRPDRPPLYDRDARELWTVDTAPCD